MRRSAASRGGALRRSEGCIVSQCASIVWAISVSPVRQPGQALLVGQRTGHQNEQAQVAATAPQRFRLRQDDGPVRLDDVLGRGLRCVRRDFPSPAVRPCARSRGTGSCCANLRPTDFHRPRGSATARDRSSYPLLPAKPWSRTGTRFEMPLFLPQILVTIPQYQSISKRRNLHCLQPTWLYPC